MDYELAVIGAGPAGFSAAIYAQRSGIKTVVFDRGAGGGLAQIAPMIENYPGFESISGFDLTQKMRQHAAKYADLHLYEEVQKIERKDSLFSIATDRAVYQVGAIILCTGTEHKKLDVPGEVEFLGRGVSYCATCDGFFFKGKKVAVIGGGNTALMEAIFLKQLGCSKVFLIHRRDQFRAEKIYVDEAQQNDIVFLLNTTVENISGSDKVRHLQVVYLPTQKQSKLEVDGVFVSVGVQPQNTLARMLELHLDTQGYIVVDKEQRTNIRGVYAAGDITGGARQVITACAQGAVAALSSVEMFGKKYPY
ncbi:MAG: thioredoxin-disulfide reductase [Candidatus Thermoplasmatota archaeon]